MWYSDYFEKLQKILFPEGVVQKGKNREVVITIRLYDF
jgi:hypothetical protein